MPKFNKNNMDKQLNQKFSRFCQQVHEELKEELEIPRFEEGFINRTTIRSSGEIVQETRNIYDTGYLQDSQNLLVVNNQASIYYTADYAPEVYYIDGGGRPWIERYLTETTKESFRQKFASS